MLFEQILNPKTGCASYFVACGGKGCAAIIDPLEDIQSYLSLSKAKNVAITHIIETHVHVDHVSGSRVLAQMTGAPIYFHEKAQVKYPFEPLKDDQELAVGNVRIKILHTPGHSPESISLLVTDTTRGTSPWFVLTGDTLFVGDVGRPDLHGDQGAELLYESVFERLLKLPDHIEIYPAHFAGSACGRKMSGKPSSTIGFERQHNHALQPRTKQDFIKFVMAELPAKPLNFVEIERKNLGLE